jgi:hypothetical protein
VTASRRPGRAAGLVGVAIWQTNRGWSRDKVVRFVQQVDIDELECTPATPTSRRPGDPLSPLEPTAPHPHRRRPRSSRRSPLGDEPELLWRWFCGVYGVRPWEMHAIYLHQYVEMYATARRLADV